MFIHAPSPFQKQPQTPSQQRPSDLRDLRVNVVKQHVTVFYRNCHIKETVKGNFTHPWKESRWWKLLYFHHCSCKSDASFQPSLPKSAQGWEASLWTLLARSPNPIWLGESLCRFTKDRLVLWSHFIPESSLQHFLIPSVFFFFFYESYYCKPLMEPKLQSPPSQDVFNIFILPCLLQWIWKSFVKWWWSEIAYSVSAKRGWRMILKRKRDFWYWQFPFSFQKWRGFFSPPLSRRTGYSVICRVLIWLPSKFLF